VKHPSDSGQKQSLCLFKAKESKPSSQTTAWEDELVCANTPTPLFGNKVWLVKEFFYL
jgi:hypothetical protein